MWKAWVKWAYLESVVSKRAVFRFSSRSLGGESGLLEVLVTRLVLWWMGNEGGWVRVWRSIDVHVSF